MQKTSKSLHAEKKKRVIPINYPFHMRNFGFGMQKWLSINYFINCHEKRGLIKDSQKPLIMVN